MKTHQHISCDHNAIAELPSSVNTRRNDHKPQITRDDAAELYAFLPAPCYGNRMTGKGMSVFVKKT